MFVKKYTIIKKKHIDLIKRIEFVAFDFDGVFTNNQVIISEDGIESVICSRSDGLGLSMLRDLGIEMAIISTESNPVVKMRAKKLRLDCYNNCENKLRVLKEISAKKNIALERVAFIGNDINDFEILNSVGLPVAVADAYPKVKKVCKIVLSKKGGYGAVREFCEIVDKIKRN